MSDELIDVCDEHNNLSGEQKMKSEAHKLGLWHRTAHVWIYNDKGEVLLQLRGKNKVSMPNRWDVSAAGHIVAGEDPIMGGLREVEEEIGLYLTENDIEFFKIIQTTKHYENIVNNEFKYIYIVKSNLDVESLQLQQEEVEDLQFFSIKKVLGDIEAHRGNYVHYGEYRFEVLKEIEGRMQ